MSRVAGLVLFCALLLGFPASGQKQANELKVGDLIARTQEALYYGNYRDAIDYLNALAVKDSTQKYYYYFQLGVAYSFSNIDNSKTLPYFKESEQGLNMDLYGAEFYYSYALANAKLYRFDEAIALYDQALTFKKQLTDESRAIINKDKEACVNAKKLTNNRSDIRIANVLQPVNTTWDEYRPVITNDESVMIFTSRRPEGTGGSRDQSGDYYEDVFITERSPLGNWNTPRTISSNVNSPGHDASIGLDEFGNTLYLYKNQEGNQGIFVSKRIDGEWSTPVPLAGGINTDKFWESSNYVTPDGKRMYFASTREGGFGGKDLYYSDLKADGNWGAAVNLGSVVNTATDEDAPFLDAANNVFYFSSNGHETMGGYDIFRAKVTADGFDKPQNLGVPVNTPLDDIHFKLSANGRRAYYSTCRDDGQGKQDIYTVILRETMLNHTVLRGQILSKDSLFRPETILLSVRESGSGKLQPYTYTPDKKGNYLLFLVPNQSYDLLVEVPGRAPFVHHFTAPYTGESFGRDHLPFVLQKIEIDDLAPLGATVGQSVRIIDNFKLPYSGLSGNTESLNRDYFKTLAELFLAASDSVISKKVGSLVLNTNQKVKRANQALNLPSFPLADRRNQFTIITDPELNGANNELLSGVNRKVWYHPVLAEDRLQREMIFGDDFAKISEQLAVENPNLDLSQTLPMATTVLNRLMSDYYSETTGSPLAPGDNQQMIKRFANEINRQNPKLTAGMNGKDLEERSVLLLSRHLVRLTQALFNGAYAAYDSTRIAGVTDVSRLSMSNSEIKSLLQVPIIGADSMTVSRQLDLYTAIYFGLLEQDANKKGINLAKDELLVTQMEKQVAFIVKLQLASYSKNRIYAERVNRLIYEEVLSQFGKLFRNIPLDNLASLNESEALSLFLQRQDTSLLKGIVRHPITMISGIKEAEIRKLINEQSKIIAFAELIDVKIQALDAQKTGSDQVVVVRGRLVADDLRENTVAVAEVDGTKLLPTTVYQPDNFGVFLFSVTPGKTYDVLVKAEGYTDTRTRINVHNDVFGKDSLRHFRYLDLGLTQLNPYAKRGGQVLSVKTNLNLPPAKVHSEKNQRAAYFSDRLVSHVYSKLSVSTYAASDESCQKLIRGYNASSQEEQQYLRNLRHFSGSDFGPSAGYYAQYAITPEQTTLITESSEEATPICGTSFTPGTIALLPVSMNSRQDAGKIAFRLIEQIVNSQTQTFANAEKSEFFADLYKAVDPVALENLKSSEQDLWMMNIINKIAQQRSSDPTLKEIDRQLAAIVLAQLDVEKSRLLAEHQLTDMTRLKVLQAIENKMKEMSVSEIAGLDSAMLARMIAQTINANSLADFPELKPEQAQLLNTIKVTDLVQLEIGKVIDENLGGMKAVAMRQHSGNADEILLVGHIQKTGVADGSLRLRFVDAQTGAIMPYSVNPDENGDYFTILNRGRNYTLVVDGPGITQQALSVDAQGPGSTRHMPIILQELMLEQYNFKQEGVGSRIAVFNTCDLDTNLVGTLLGWNLMSLAQIRDSLILLKEVFKAETDTLYRLAGARMERGDQGLYLAANMPEENQVKLRRDISSLATRMKSGQTEMIAQAFQKTGAESCVFNTTVGRESTRRIYLNGDTIEVLPAFIRRVSEFNYTELAAILEMTMLSEPGNDEKSADLFTRMMFSTDLSLLDAIQTELSRFDLPQDALRAEIIAAVMSEWMANPKTDKLTPDTDKTIELATSRVGDYSTQVAYKQHKDQLVTGLMDTIAGRVFVLNVLRRLRTMDADKITVFTEEDWKDMILEEQQKTISFNYLAGLRSELNKLEVSDLQQISASDLLAMKSEELQTLFTGQAQKLNTLGAIKEKLVTLGVADTTLIDDDLEALAAADLQTASRILRTQVATVKGAQIKALQTDSTMLLKGRITFDHSLHVPYGIRVSITAINKRTGEEVANVQQPDSKGEYLMLLQPNEEYELIVRADGYAEERVPLKEAQTFKYMKLPYIGQDIHLQEVRSLDVRIGQQVTLTSYNPQQKEIQEKYFKYTVLGADANAALNGGKNTVPTVIWMDAVKGKDMGELTAMIVSLALKPAMNDSEMVVWLKDHKRFKFSELSAISTSSDLLLAMNDEDRRVFAAIIAETLRKVSSNDSLNLMSEAEKEMLILNTLANAAIANQKVSKDPAVLQKNKVAYLLEAHSKETLASDIVAEKRRKQAEFTVLALLKSTLNTMSSADVVMMDETALRQVIASRVKQDSIWSKSVTGQDDQILESVMDSVIYAHAGDVRMERMQRELTELPPGNYLYAGTFSLLPESDALSVALVDNERREVIQQVSIKNGGAFAFSLENSKSYSLLLNPGTQDAISVPVVGGKPLLGELPVTLNRFSVSEASLLGRRSGLYLSHNQESLDSKGQPAGSKSSAAVMLDKHRPTPLSVDYQGTGTQVYPVVTSPDSVFRFRSLSKMVVDALAAIDPALLAQLTQDELYALGEATLADVVKHDDGKPQVGIDQMMNERATEVIATAKSRKIESENAKKKVALLAVQQFGVDNATQWINLTDEQTEALIFNDPVVQSGLRSGLITRDQVLDEIRVRRQAAELAYSEQQRMQSTRETATDNNARNIAAIAIPAAKETQKADSLIAIAEVNQKKSIELAEQRTRDSLVVVEKLRKEELAAITKQHEAAEKIKQKETAKVVADTAFTNEIARSDAARNTDLKAATQTDQQYQAFLASAESKSKAKVTDDVAMNSKQEKKKQKTEKSESKSNQATSEPVRFPDNYNRQNADYTLYYEFDKYYVMPNHYDALKAVKELFASNDGVKIIVEGHTDDSGPDAYNELISRRRAAAIKRKLVKMGCDESRIQTQAAGESMPRYENQTREGREKNRRTEIFIIR